MTNKVKFKLKITGFELEMEGTKESTAQITSQVSETLRGLIKPPTLEDDEKGRNGQDKSNHTEDVDVTVISSTAGNKRRRTSSSRNKQNSGVKVEAKALDFKNEPEKFGTPIMKWSTSTRSLWILYVVKNTLNIDGLTSHEIAETFNKHFRQAKMIRSFTISRDLGKLKIASSNALVGEDTTKDPAVWYITEAGEKHIQKIIAEQKAQVNGVS